MHQLQYHFTSDVVPRRQFNFNSGYCGETSFICAGMSFGQYCSQYTARSLASPQAEHQSDSGSQLLLGRNDVTAADAMRLRASEFDHAAQQDTQEFIAWTKRCLLAGYVPIIGVFNNGIILDEWHGSDEGDPDYDHIVPVLGWASDAPLDMNDGSYRWDDVITFSDNGLYGPIGVPERYPLLFFYEAASFQGTRQQANNPEGPPIYMLKNTPQNYGIAIEGIKDLDGACIPVRLSTDTDHEPETPRDIQLTVTVELPDPDVAYNLYRYDDFARVPVAGFNAAARDAVEVEQIPAGSGPTVVKNLTVESDRTVVFRAVRASAP